jgi:hypothetical protein
MKKILTNFNHHLDDYECMWNGIEDIYQNKTNSILPKQFFFAMSGFCEFAYLTTNKQAIKRRLVFGDGRTDPMYEKIAEIVGFDFQKSVSSSPNLALQKAKKELDQNRPLVIGALDMYYLTYYPKLFHHEHIPFHYLLLIGYDDEKEEVTVLDCGRTEPQTLSYQDLFLAWNATYPGLTKPNTIYKITMNQPKSVEEIATTCLLQKANAFLNPPVSFLGYKGMEKFQKELPNWEKTLGTSEVKKIWSELVPFFGSVPTTPALLKGLPKEEDGPIVFQASRDKFARVLEDLAIRMNLPELKEASLNFFKSGEEYQKVCDALIEYLLTDKDYVPTVLKSFAVIEQEERQGFEIIRQALTKN